MRTSNTARFTLGCDRWARSKLKRSRSLMPIPSMLSTSLAHSRDSDMSTHTAEEKLRVIEPFRMHGHLVAEVFVSKIGADAIVALEFDTDNGDTASLSLTP